MYYVKFSSPTPSAMANIARHVIANEYSEDIHDSTSNSDGGGRVPSTISEDTREDSPLSTTSSGQEHVETAALVCEDHTHGPSPPSFL